MEETNPHDGKQLLNKPWLETEDGGIEILEGSQHKYPQCQLVFDQTTQNCFALLHVLLPPRPGARGPRHVHPGGHRADP